ncbi:hypothetical protein ACKI1O_49095, partial [Streptomyces scabiei]
GAGVSLRALAALLAAERVELGRSDRWFDNIGAAPAGAVEGTATAGVPSPEANPDFARWNDVIARRRAMLELERRRAIPDVTIGAGIRRYSDT